jgi:hypothetical protein
VGKLKLTCGTPAERASSTQVTFHKLLFTDSKRSGHAKKTELKRDVTTVKPAAQRKVHPASKYVPAGPVKPVQAGCLQRKVIIWLAIGGDLFDRNRRVERRGHRGPITSQISQAKKPREAQFHS